MSDLSPEMVSRMAEAMHQTQLPGLPQPHPWDSLEERHKRDYRLMAEAALRALGDVDASHPLVALWREWVEARNALGEAIWTAKAPWTAEQGKAMTRLSAAESALLNYRSDT